MKVTAIVSCLMLTGCIGLSFGEIAFIHSTNSTLSETSRTNLVDKGLEGQAFKPPHLQFAKLPKDPGLPDHLKVECTITEEGRVARPVEVKDTASENPTLNTQTSDAMDRWRFTPATLDGKPVPVRVVIVVRIDPRGTMYDGWWPMDPLYQTRW